MGAAQAFTLVKNKSELSIVNELGYGRSYLTPKGWLVIINSSYFFLVFYNRADYRKAVEASDLTDKEKGFLLKFLSFLISARKSQGRFNFSPESYLEIFNNGISLIVEGIDLVINKMYNKNESRIATGLEILNDVLKGINKDLIDNFTEHVKNPSKFFKRLNAIRFLDVVQDILIFLPSGEVEEEIIKTSISESLELYDGYFNLKKYLQVAKN